MRFLFFSQQQEGHNPVLGFRVQELGIQREEQLRKSGSACRVNLRTWVGGGLRTHAYPGPESPGLVLPWVGCSP